MKTTHSEAKLIIATSRLILNTIGISEASKYLASRKISLTLSLAILAKKYGNVTNDFLADNIVSEHSFLIAL